MIRTFDYQSAVNPYTGEINTPLKIASRPGRNGLDIDLNIFYTSNVWNEARTWNLNAPTGVLGLGWELPFQSIVVDTRLTGSRANDQYYLVGGASTDQLICTGTTANGALQFSTTAYHFWSIQYQPATETWTIIKENGDVFTFGDASSNCNTVDWLVTWGNWMGASGQVSGQKKQPAAWRLSQVSNRFHDTVTYYYVAISMNAGSANGLAFTQASYLDKIVGVTGDSLQFFYNEKSTDEYQPPHSNPPPPNAWQSPLQTRYLDHVTEVSASGQTLITHTFGYGTFGSGSLTKRLLLSVISTYPNGQSQPAINFSYFGQDPDDGVNPTTIFNPDKSALYGALKQVTLPLGGTVSLAYTSCTANFSNRELTATAPVVTGVTYSKPRFYFQDDFVITTWFGSDTTIGIQAYTWDGRWLSSTFSGIPLADASAYDTLEVTTAKDLFAVFTGNRLYPFFRSLGSAGQWQQPAEPSGGNTVPYYSPGYTGETVTLAAGDLFVALIGDTSGKLNRYTWNGASWIASPQVTLSAGTDPCFTIVAQDNYLFAAAHPQSGQYYLFLYSLDQTGVWQQNYVITDSNLSQANSITVYPAATYVIFCSISSLAGSFRAEYGVAWWTEDFSMISTEKWGVQTYNTATEIAVPQVQGSLVAIGQLVHRFNGVAWTFADLSTITYPNQQAVEVIEAGCDNVLRRIRTTNANPYVYDLVQYDPGTGQWSVPANMHIEAASDTLGLAAPRTGNGDSHYNAVGNYVVLAGKLWYQAPDASWSSPFTLPDALTSADLPSLQLIRSAYLLYQVNTGSSAVTTKIFTLRNGTVVSTIPIPLTGEQITAAGLASDALVGLYGLLSYTGDYGTSNSVMTVRRVINDAVANAQTLYPAASIQVNDGYERVLTGYVYDAPTATVDQDGYTLQCNKSTSIPGAANTASAISGYTENYFFNGLIPTDTPAWPYPVDAANTNATSFYSVVKGLQYAVLVYNKATGGVSVITSQTTNYTWVTALQLGQLGTGFYSRIRRYDTILDQVLSSVLQQYSPDTGELTQTTKTNYNSSGDQLQLIESLKYWWEIYDTSRTLNMLTPVVQVTEISTDVTTRQQSVNGTFITTWKQNWGLGADAWAPYCYYRAQNANPAPFTSWNPNDPPPGADWLLTGQVLFVEQTGQVSVSTNALGNYKSTIYDSNHFLKVAEASNSNINGGELSYLGFEPYEKLNGWLSSQPGTSLWQQVTTADFYTGTQCLQLSPQPGQQYGPYQIFQPTDQTRKFIFGCWAQVANGFDPAQGKAAFEITFYKQADNTKVTPATLTLDLSSAAGTWTYFQQVIDLDTARTAGGLPAGTPLYFKIQGYNQNSTAMAWVDNLRYSPTDGVFGATVYDPVDFRTVGIIDNNGQAILTVFNGFSQPVASVGPVGRVNEVQSISLSRDLFGAGVFQQKFPNSELKLTTTSQSEFYDFHDGRLADWTFSDNAWSISNGELTYTGSNTSGLGSTAMLNVVAYTNFAARVVVSRVQQANLASVAIGNGVYFVRWNQTATQWELIQLAQDGTITVQATYNKVGFLSEWIYAIVDGFITFYANGIQLFSYQYTYPDPVPQDYGKLQLALTQSGAFDNLLLLHEPQMKVSFFNGLGNPTQEISLEGRNNAGVYTGQYSGVGKGVLVDSLGRAQYIREQLTAKMTIATASNGGANSPQLLAGDTDTYLYNEAGTKLTVEQFLNADELHYTTQAFESSPISRVTSRILPRMKTADSSMYTESYTYSASTSPDTPTPPVPGSTGKYFVQRATWTQSVDNAGMVTNVERIRIFDLTGLLLKELRGKTGGPYQATGYIYDGAGRMINIRQPNFFTPPGNSDASTWLETNAYTYNGLLSRRITPDSNTTNFIYDNGNRLRFVLDANGANLSTQRIIYFKYDALDRMLESGYIQDANYQWGANGAALQAKANTQPFPITDPNQSHDPNYAAGVWKKKLYYDQNPATPKGLYLVGRCWKVQINNGGATADTETYTYDAFGNRLQVASVVSRYNNNSYSFVYRYNNQDQVQSIQYPVMVGHNNFAVGYYYNRLGQLASVGQDVPDHGVIDPSNPPTGPEKAYAAYTYDFYGRPQAVLMNSGVDPMMPYTVRRWMQYDTAGLLTQIVDALPGPAGMGPDMPFFTQDLFYYAATSPNTTKYYNGFLGAYQAAYQQAGNIWSALPAGFNNQYQYDTQGRLTAANNSLEDAWSIAAGTATPYDPNGNTLSQLRGQALTTYQYQSSGGKQISNQVSTLQSVVNTSMNFEGIPPSATSAGDWSWGSNNGGPSATGIDTADHHTGTQCLKLGGGSLTHNDSLLFLSYLDPTGGYSLGWWTKTPDGFAQATGEAGWYANIYGATGKVAEKKLVDITASATWAQQTVTVDLGTLLALSLNEPASYITLELRNYKRSIDGSAGPYLLIDDITLSGTVTSGAYTYDKDGNTIGTPNNCFAIGYDPVIAQCTTIQLGSATGNRLQYSYSADDQRSLQQFTGADGTTVFSSMLRLTGLNDKPLVERTMVNDEEVVQLYIYGLQDILAFGDGNQFQYLLTDHLGSPRVLISDTRVATNAFDYLPFGGKFRQQAPSTLNYFFTGEEYDPLSHLYDRGVELYDPQLQRYLSIGSGQAFTDLYSYMNNNPVNLTDELGQALIRPVGFWYDAPFRDGTAVPAKDITNVQAKLLNDYYRNDHKNDNIDRGGGDISVRITEQKRIIEELGKKIYLLYRGSQYSEKVMAVDLETGEQMELPEDSYIFVWREKDNAVFAHSGRDRIWQDRVHDFCLNLNNPETSIKHSQIAERDKIHSGGKFEYRNGRLTWINNSSGHYHPENFRVPDFKEKLEKLNVNTLRLEIRQMAGAGKDKERAWKLEEDNLYCPGNSCFTDWVIRDTNNNCRFTNRVYANLKFKKRHEW